jgi:hypothetical protein
MLLQEMYNYPCFIIVIEQSALRSCQLALKVLPSDGIASPCDCTF